MREVRTAGSRRGRRVVLCIARRLRYSANFEPARKQFRTFDHAVFGIAPAPLSCYKQRHGPGADHDAQVHRLR
jgi:hypothetical protein